MTKYRCDERISKKYSVLYFGSKCHLLSCRLFLCYLNYSSRLPSDNSSHRSVRSFSNNYVVCCASGKSVLLYVSGVSLSCAIFKSETCDWSQRVLFRTPSCVSCIFWSIGGI